MQWSRARYAWNLFDWSRILSVTSSALNRIPITRKDMSKDAEDSGVVLIWISSATQPDSRKLWSGMLCHLIAGSLSCNPWYAYITTVYRRYSTPVVLFLLSWNPGLAFQQGHSGKQWPRGKVRFMEPGLSSSVIFCTTLCERRVQAH